ncbi:hypothetical protein RGU72_05150 [Undibacterium sp. 5I1]|uniref:hypothetical protein n=1 Tax=unclassified Undibacterium TaxID=2630295 RepID=UPI002AB3BDC8|nr:MULTISPECIES: hypothetical protein [unclassified Undibacterium]MDY7537641.1 hypothetical protein [Undibacterium sp. 5I1]MEB0230186.1 hypothetical protein [Undibacterium sp. 10I3]MEB0256378.1 hypothetical protein [Undibacterium sp. 5I1]
MSEDELNALKATMPWQERLFNTNRGAIVQVVDVNGMEVPLFTMTKFLIMITNKLAQPVKERSNA